MRTIIYAVFNKETRERVFTNINRYKCEDYINSLDNKENYVIGHKWFSI